MCSGASPISSCVSPAQQAFAGADGRAFLRTVQLPVRGLFAGLRSPIFAALF